jgi:hypothetical protein
MWKMEKTKHTPTPWQPDGAGRLLDSKGAILAEIVYRGFLPNKRAKAEQQANTEFIVRACNSYDKMVATARTIVGSCESVNIGDMDAEHMIQFIHSLATQVLREVGALEPTP